MRDTPPPAGHPRAPAAGFATGAVAEHAFTAAAWPLAAALPAAMLPLAWYALRPAHELHHHTHCTPAAAGITLERARLP